jgi:archaellum component FlaC
MAIAASLGLPIIDPVKKDIPDNLKCVIKDLMEISSGIVSDNKSTKMAAVQAMKKKFSELGLFSWLDIADDGTMRSKPGMSIGSAKAQIAASLGPNTHLPISPDQLPNTIQAIANSIDLKGLEAEWYVDGEFEEYQEGDEYVEYEEDIDGTCYYEPEDEIDGRSKSSGSGRVKRCSCPINHLAQRIRNGEHDSDLEYLFDTENDDLNHIDPVKLQVVQTAEHELSSVYSLFESKQLSEEEKLGVLKRKYMELMQQDIKHRLDRLRTKEAVQAIELERDSAKTEIEKMNRLKAKLESLCADLQEENRKIKAEALKRLDEHNATATSSSKCKLKNGCSRCGCTLDLSTAFPSLPDLPEVGSLQKAGAKVLAEQLHKFVDIYRLRERHFKALMQEKDAELDIQLAKTLNAELSNDALKQRIDAYERQIAGLSRAENELKNQLAIYVDKFKQVEETLGKSNDLFATFRREMEQMTAKLGRLESENHQLQNKCNTLSRNIIEMADERTKQSASYESLKAQKAKLEQLCRTLQAERKAASP